MLSIGDLAQSLVLLRNQTRLKTDIDRFGTELATGLTTDPAARLKGDTGPLQNIEYALAQLDTFRVTATEASLRGAAAQAALGNVQDASQSLTASLLGAELLVDPSARATLASQAADALETIVSALNSSSGGRQLFSGTATDRPPLVAAEDLVADLALHVTGLTEASDIEAAVDAWFDTPGGGFETQTYQGSADDLAPQTLRPGVSIQFEVRADDAEIRDVLKGVALAAVASGAGLGISPATETDLLMAASAKLLRADGPLTEARAVLGMTEARIDEVRARNSAENSALELARLELVAVDPYDTAVRLEQATVQLQSLYSATARASRLSLLDWLR